MKRVILVTGHYLRSKRKAGFHFLAESFHASGWDVLFFTAPVSWLSWLRRDHRFNYPIRREANRVCQVDERLSSFVWLTPWHPANLRSRALNNLLHRVANRYADLSLGDAEDRLREADLIVFESTPALMLFDRVRVLCPSARLVYRVSDDLRLLRSHPSVIATESRIARHFDLISVPCRYLYDRFESQGNARLQPHGIRKDLFDHCSLPSPYDNRWKRHAVFAGNDLFDHDFLERACVLFPDWAFHIIGPIRGLPAADNVLAYGEIPFAETVPYLKHANIGLQTLRYVGGAESFSESLKVIQYAYCGLPVIAPDYMATDRNNFCFYRIGDGGSIARALNEAAAFDRSSIDRSGLMSWKDLTEALAGEDAPEPAEDVLSGPHAAC